MDDYIYHYTSIETLALILKNKNIRFNSLKNVDDINETEFSDENEINLSSHVLISCWTNNEEENLAFWHMYTPNMKGVRIKLSKNLFHKYSFTTEYVADIQDTLITESLVPENECFNQNYWIVPFSENFLEIVYTEQEDLLKPKILQVESESFTVKIGEIGKYKSKIWEFQKEVRFKLFVLPSMDSNGTKIHPLDDFQKIMTNKIPSPIENYFIEIKDDAFKNMEITLGPKCTISEEIIVEALLQRFNPTAKISKNKFQGLIR